ncbi:MAG TPA: DUF4388 domain-containing protein [Myxococcales bacterium]
MTRRRSPAAPAPSVERGGASFAVLDSVPDLLIALQEGAPGLLADVRSLGTAGVVLAGDLATFPPADLLNFLHNGRRDGVLLARSGGTERAVALIEGNVAWACSASPAERLGEVACRMGLADRARVHDLLKTQREAAAVRRIGQLLVQSGSMAEEDLPRAMRHQVIEIFLGLLVAQSGAFLFLRGCDRARLPNDFALDTEALLLDGLRRLDEMELFRGRVSGLHVRPRRSGKPALEELPADAQIVLGMAEGALTLGQIAAASALGEFETTRVVYRLAVAGLVVLDE